MTRYLIDIRLMGPVKHQIMSLRNRLQETFRLENNLTTPHITLAGPFTTRDEKRLLEDFARVCSAGTTIPSYTVGGYSFFAGTRVICVTITPDDALKDFRYRLASEIAPYCTLREYDREPAEDFRFHATLAMKLDWLTFQRIRWYFRNQDQVTHHPHPIRATLLRNSRILCEYDFLQQRMLSPSQARCKATRVRYHGMLRAWERKGRD